MMNKNLLAAMLVLGGAVLSGQEITGLAGAQKNGQGDYVNKDPLTMNGILRFSEVLEPGYYSLSCKIADNFPTVFWSQKGAVIGYTHCRTAVAPGDFQYYFKVTDGSKLAFMVRSYVPKENKVPVEFTAGNFKLTALKEIPSDMFPDFQKALKETPDEKNFIYCFSDHKTTMVTKETIDGIPVMSVEGTAEKLYASTGCTVPFPAVNSGKLTVKFTAKSGEGSKQMFIVVRDFFWKKGGVRKYFTLTGNWTEYKFEIDCSQKFKEGIVLAVADFRFSQGVYLFKDFSINYTK